MTLEEAIEHCKDVEKEKRYECAECMEVHDYRNAEECNDCAEKHKQLAGWLEELQQRRGRATELAALESLRKQINKTGRVRGISGTIVQSVRPCVASGVRAAIQTLIDLTNKEIIAQEEGGAENG